MHYYQHHIGDFIKDTANLDDHQLATYLRMIWAYYTDEKPFEDDCESIAFAMRSHEKTVRLILKHYFILSPDGWRHGRCDREINAFRGRSESARNSANARWKNANALPPHSDRNANEPLFDANQEPITNNQQPRKAKQDQKTTSAPRRDWLAELIELGVHENHARDWLEVRRGKKAKMTDTVVDGIQREARRANVSFGEAIRISAESGWQGFKADWLSKPAANGGSQFMTKQERIELANQKVLEEICAREDARVIAEGGVVTGHLLIEDDPVLTIEGDFFNAT